MSDAAREFHRTWLGMVQPTEGLVVTAAALVEAGAFQRLSAEDHRAFLELLEPSDEVQLRDPRELLLEGLGWADEPDAVVDGPDLPEALSLHVPEGPQTLRPTAALRVPAYLGLAEPGDTLPPAAEAAREFQLLIWELPPELDQQDRPFDVPETATGPWRYPLAKKLERVLRHSRVPLGLLVGRRVLRLLYAPHGESAGHIDFRVPAMADITGRPIFDALVMLLGVDRLYRVATDRQLSALCAESRKLQSEVTTELSKQVQQAMETLLRGFEAADARAGGAWLRPVMEQSDRVGRDVLFDALLTVLLRLVFLLYAEDAGLLPSHPRFRAHYSLVALHARLQADHARVPDAMSRRFSAWPALLALFRAIYLGASHGDLKLPPREGHLFDPARFPFLEGFDPDAPAVPLSGAEADAEARAEAAVPTIDDGTLYQVLSSLLYLGGERLSYRALQVEQIGSVYEGLMGWATERVVAPSVRLRPSVSGRAPKWVSAEELLAVPRARRAKWLGSEANLKGKRANALAKDLGALEKEPAAVLDAAAFEAAVLERMAEERVRGSEVAQPGRIVLQPGPERQRTSSHYTPPDLAGEVVERALEPLLACFGEAPTAAQILSLKVCDPAMGSGAFLVSACRYLGERLLEAWSREEQDAAEPDPLRSAEDDLTTYARRQVAERCLYGVDKNSVAVELAKLSLWLVTLQRDKPFTFLDHALRCGDSLVGCSLEQIVAFDWAPKKKQKKKRAKKGEQLELFDRELESSLSEALEARERIAAESRHDTPEANREMRVAMRDADDALSRLRLIGDLLVGAFFSADKDKARKKERDRRRKLVEEWLMDVNAPGPPPELVALAEETRALRPFHWMLEFPEVFYQGRVDPLTGAVEDEPAFLDAVIGNPPFLGGKRISSELGGIYPLWLENQSGGNRSADLCARFFLRAHELLGEHGTMGLIATNTIAQGDTREAGLARLLAREAVIYDARDSLKWETGDAAVTVSTVHLSSGRPCEFVRPRLDGVPQPVINSRLRPTPERAAPQRLEQNGQLSFQGSIVLGMGFTLTPEEREALVAKDPKNGERIKPYLGGQEVNSSPTHDFHRYVIDFGAMSLEEAERWPDLIEIVRREVKPDRDRQKRKALRERWWQFADKRPGLYEVLNGRTRCLVTSRVSKHLLFHFQPTGRVFSDRLYVFPIEAGAGFAALQSRVHERWARLLSSTLETRMNYAATDCFETFPFPRPDPRGELPALEAIGQTLYDERAAFMVDTDQGLTATYNLLKDPAVTRRDAHGDRIERLRELHVQMDRAVLDAYASETSDATWSAIEVPPFTDPATASEEALHQAFEDHVLDHLFALNEERANR